MSRLAPPVLALPAVARPDTTVREETHTTPALPWQLIVWDDPVNLMSYVTYVFTTYFGYPRAKAEQLMLQVHHEGKAIVATGNREKMEVDAAAMHNYGLWATISKASG